MATRSYVLFNDKTNVKGFYIHWDGYPEHNGKLLYDFFKYEDLLKTWKIGKEHYISAMGVKNTFNNDEDKFESINDNVDICTQKATKKESSSFSIKKENLDYWMKTKTRHVDYVYLFENNEWSYFESTNIKDKKSLEETILEIKKQEKQNEEEMKM